MSERLKTPMVPVVFARDEDAADLRRAHIPTVEPRSVRQADDAPKSTRKNNNETVRSMVAALPLAIDCATITVIHGVNAGQVFTIEGDSAVVGRDSSAEFPIDDPAISRKHCRFRLSDDRVFVEDLGSANGTIVSGQRLRPGQLFELFAGDRVQLGPTAVVRFSLSDRVEEQMQRRLYEAATRDALTGVFSRAYLTERLGIEIASARRHRGELSLLIISIDKYSDTAARLGGKAGARLVRAVAGKLHDSLGVDDLLGRFGGERFAVVVRSANTLGASVLGERLRAAVKELSSTTTLSIGAASLDEVSSSGNDERDLVALAEARLAEAVRDGGDCTQATRPNGATFRAVRR